MNIKSTYLKSDLLKSNLKTLLTAQATAVLTGMVLLCSASLPALAKNLAVNLESIPMGNTTFYMVTFEQEDESKGAEAFATETATMPKAAL